MDNHVKTILILTYDSTHVKVLNKLKKDKEYNSIKTIDRKIKYRLKKEYFILKEYKVTIIDLIYWSILSTNDFNELQVYHKLILKAESMLNKNPTLF